MTPISPTLAEAMRRYEASRGAARAVAEGLGDAAFHRAPPLFIAGTGPGRGGAAPAFKVRTRPVFEPGDPAARGRTRDHVLADFLANQDRLDASARAADGLDLTGVKVASVIAGWVRVSLGAWFLAIAGHQERHLDQARRARAAIVAAGFGEATGAGGP